MSARCLLQNVRKTTIAQLVGGLFAATAVAPGAAQLVIVGDNTIQSQTWPPSPAVDTLILGNQAGGSGTLNFDGDTLNINHAGGYSGFVTVGNQGTGTFNLSNGSGDTVITISGPGYVSPLPATPPNDWGGYLFVGRGDGGTGVFNMTDASAGSNLLNLSVQNEIQIGGSNVSVSPGGGFTCLSLCSGQFNQDGGVVTAGSITVGIGAGSGAYVLNSGTVNAFLDIGNSGFGSFTQNAGVVNAGGMFVGNGGGSTGSYTLNDGVLNSGSFAHVGVFGNGTFNQNGGTHTAGTVVLGSASSSAQGQYNIGAGSLNISGEFVVGRGGVNDFSATTAGTVLQTGGDVTAARILVGGYFNVATSERHYGRGRYELSNGTVTSSSTEVGWLSQGSVVQTGGTFNAGALRIGGSGLFSQDVGNGPEPYSHGTYELRGGELNTASTTVSVFGIGVFNHSGGSHNVTGNLMIGDQPAFTEPGNGFVTQGTYTLSGAGVLTVFGTTTIANGNNDAPGLPGGLGTFNQTGGAAILNDLIVGAAGSEAGGAGRINLSGGQLSVFGSMTLGQGNGSGVVQMSGGALTVANQLVVGQGGAFFNSDVQGQFTQSDGTVTAGTILIGGDRFNTNGRGIYNLSGGTVTASATDVGNNGRGVVNQSGGTFNAGNLVLGNSGLLSVDVGNGPEFYSSGTYNLSAGALNTTGTTVSVFGMGSFTQTGGDHNVTGVLTVGSQPALAEPITGTQRQGFYGISAGNLAVSGLTIIGAGNSFFAGEPGALGTFDQNGGSVTLGDNLIVGGSGSIAGGTGFYNLNGASSTLTINNGAALIVAQAGASGLFTQTNGTVTVSGFLTVGEDSGANGTYRLSGGTITSGNAIVGGGLSGVGGVGSFEQSGGTFQTGFLNMGGGGFVQKGFGSYTLTAGNLIVDNNLIMGNNDGGQALFNQSGGTVAINSAVFGAFINNGTYALSGNGTVNVVNNLVVGGVGGSLSGVQGNFNQSGTSQVTVGGDLAIATVTDSAGAYRLNGGTLTTGRAIVGDVGLGSFTQNSGTHNVTSAGGAKDLIVGNQAGSDGTYNALGGTLNVGRNAIIGKAGKGIFTVAGTAVVNVAGLTIVGETGTGVNSGALNVGGNGSYTSTGGITVASAVGTTGNVSVTNAGTLSTNGRFTVGGQGAATMLQAGTSTVTAGGLRVGEQAGSSASYTLQGGTLNVLDTSGVNGGTRVGIAGTGTFNQTAGTHNTTFMEIGGATFGQGGGGTGTYNLSGGAVVATGNIAVKPNTGSGTGALNVSGGTLNAPSITNNDQVNYSGGSITANVGNNANFNVSGGAARTLTGNLSNNAGGTLTVAAATPFTVTGILTQAAGANILASANITVGQDYNNLGSGGGNSYDRRAGVTGAGQILAAGAGAATAQTLSGNVTGANATGATMNFGNVRVGQANTLNYAIGNSNTGGPDLRGAIQTTVNGANLTDSRLAGTGVTAGTWGPVAAGGDSGNLGVTFNATTAGALVNQKVAVVNNFENTNSQVLTISGAAYSAAAGNATPSPIVNLGNVRVGGTLAQTFNVTNTATGPAGFVEDLNANFGGSTGNAGATGSINGLVAGASNSSAMSANLGTGSSGAKTGTVQINYQTAGTVNGSTIVGLGTAAAGNQTITLNGGVYQAAAGAIQANGNVTGTPGAMTYNFGTIQVGQTVSQNLVVRNTASGAANFVEDLNVAFGSSSNSQITGSGGLTGIRAGTNSTAANGTMAVSITATTANSNFTGNIGVNYTSAGTVNGTTIAGLGTLGVGNELLGVNGVIQANVVGQAVAQINNAQPINLGNVRVGAASPSVNVSVSNVAAVGSAALNATITGNAPITASGSFTLLPPGAPGVAAATDNTSLSVGMNTATAGAKNGTATLNFVSDASNIGGCGLNCQVTLASQNVNVTGNVYQIANGAATPTPVTIAAQRIGGTNSQALTVTNNAANTGGFTEDLRATFGSNTGNATNNGGSINVLVQGGNSTAMSVGVDTSTAGAKSGTVTLNYQTTGTVGGVSNTLGVAAANGPQVITVSGDVYRLANPQNVTSSVTLAARVGGAASGSINITNQSPDQFTEALRTTAGAAPGGFTVIGSPLTLAAQASGNLGVNLNTATAGNFGGTVTLNHVSSGVGTTGAADANVGSSNVNLTGRVYTQAAATVQNSVNFGIVHVGDVVGSQGIAVTNSAPVTALNDTLRAAIGAAGGAFATSGGPVSGLNAGSTDNSTLRVALNTGTAGNFNGSASVALTSQNPDLSDLALGNQTVNFSGQVNKYANAEIHKSSGAGSLTRAGNVFTLNFGNVVQGSGNLLSNIDILNLVNGGPADDLNGTLAIIDLNDFANNLLQTGVANLGADQSSGDVLALLFNSGLALGTYNDSITFDWFGTNGSGYRDANNTLYTLNIVGTIIGQNVNVPEPGTLLLLTVALAGLGATRRRKAA